MGNDSFQSSTIMDVEIQSRPRLLERRGGPKITLELPREIQANENSTFAVTFFNDLDDQERKLTESAVNRTFTKFGPVSEIKYAEHGRVFISYKEKEGAFKALHPWLVKQSTSNFFAHMGYLAFKNSKHSSWN